jgi:hypothetical protein
MLKSLISRTKAWLSYPFDYCLFLINKKLNRVGFILVRMSISENKIYGITLCGFCHKS